jgi:Ca2+-binding RTX toxin-like protein
VAISNSTLIRLGLVPDILGTSGNDMLVGTNRSDSFAGRGSDDFIELFGPNDQARGGTGNDTILGGDGDDFLRGGDGRDEVPDGRGDDLIGGEAGRDILFGGLGDDLLGDSYHAPDLMSLTPLLEACRSDRPVDLFAGFDPGTIAGDVDIEADIVLGGAGDDRLIVDRQRELASVQGDLTVS